MRTTESKIITLLILAQISLYLKQGILTSILAIFIIYYMILDVTQGRKEKKLMRDLYAINLRYGERPFSDGSETKRVPAHKRFMDKIQKQARSWKKQEKIEAKARLEERKKSHQLNKIENEQSTKQEMEETEEATR